jgi:hypothetical protein
MAVIALALAAACTDDDSTTETNPTTVASSTNTAERDGGSPASASTGAPDTVATTETTAPTGAHPAEVRDALMSARAALDHLRQMPSITYTSDVHLRRDRAAQASPIGHLTVHVTRSGHLSAYGDLFDERVRLFTVDDLIITTVPVAVLRSVGVDPVRRLDERRILVRPSHLGLDSQHSLTPLGVAASLRRALRSGGDVDVVNLPGGDEVYRISLASGGSLDVSVDQPQVITNIVTVIYAGSPEGTG